MPPLSCHASVPWRKSNRQRLCFSLDPNHDSWLNVTIFHHPRQTPMQDTANYSAPSVLSAFAERVMDAALMPDFARQITHVFQDLVPGAVVSLDEIHPASATYLLAHTLPEGESVVTQAIGRLQQVYMQSPVHQYMDADGPEQVLDLQDLAPRRQLLRTDFYQDVLRPLGLGQQVAVRLDRPEWSCTLTLNRDKPFSDELKRFLYDVRPILVAAHRVACEVRRLRELVRSEEQRSAFLTLTPKEQEVMVWMRQGKRNSEISLILRCSVRTIEKHVENILRKTGTETRTAAVLAYSGT